MVIADDFGVPAYMSLWSLDVFFFKGREQEETKLKWIKDG
jgi:hypothetical protein